MNRVQVRGAFEFITGNDGEFGEAVQRALAAYCILNHCAYADVAPMARHWVRYMGKSGGNFTAQTWFDLLRSQRGAWPRLTVVEGGAP
ncbi:MAG TPA: hypothetical protein VJN18_25075 [Polyangiaceae bacterium]|nr:hypothetical protein [Polyangiaceae bacterium]